jgi:hypothetical protein
METLVFDISDDLPVPLSDIADNVMKIELETTDECLLDNVRQVELFENYLLVKDRSTFLYVFDMQGRFIRRIGMKGNGPGEYSFCLSFLLDEQNKKISLWTNIGILLYDIEGNFLEKIPLRPSWSGSINNVFFDNNLFYTLEDVFFDGYQDKYFCVYDNNLNVVDSLQMYRYKVGKGAFISNHPKPFSRNEGRIYVYAPPYNWDSENVSDTLYIVDNLRLRPFLEVQLSNWKKDEDIYWIFRTARYTVVSYRIYVQQGQGQYKKEYRSQCIYDYKTKNGRHAKDGFTDDIYDHDHVIISPLFRQDLFYYLKEGEYSEELRAEPNPTVYIGKFKE